MVGKVGMRVKGIDRRASVGEDAKKMQVDSAMCLILVGIAKIAETFPRFLERRLS